MNIQLLDVSEVVDKDNGVIIVCNMGGTFDIAHPTIGNPTRLIKYYFMKYITLNIMIIKDL